MASNATLAKPNPGSTDPNYFPVDSLPEEITVNPKTIASGRPLHRDMASTKKRHGWYSDNIKMKVACCYAVTGNSKRVSEMTKVPEGTIRAWKQTEWWHEIQSRIRLENNEELDTKLTRLVDKAVEQINDRLDNGDFIYNIKQDKLVRKPVGAKDLASITATTLDKRQLLRGEPTSRVQKVSENEKLVRLAEEFKKFALAKTIESTAINIEVDNAIEDGLIEEGNLPEYQDGDGEWETTEASSGDSSVERKEEQEDGTETPEEENVESFDEDNQTLTINEMFTE
jgi:hypothetical protein